MLLLEDRTHKVALSDEVVVRRVVLTPPKPASPPKASSDNWTLIVEHSSGSDVFSYPTDAEAQEAFDKATGATKGPTASSYAKAQSKS